METNSIKNLNAPLSMKLMDKIYEPPLPVTAQDEVVLDSTGTSLVKKPWTILYYMAGNNSIADDMLKKISRMESVGSDKNVNIVVQLGRPSKVSYLPGGYRFYIEKKRDKTPKYVRFSEFIKGSESKFIEDYRVVKDNSPENSIKITPDVFIKYGIKKIPSNLKKLANIYKQNNSLDIFREKIEKYPSVLLFETTEIVSEPIEKLGTVDMSNPESLADFIVWGNRKFPSENTLLVIMDHGYGFLGSPDDNEKKTTMSLNQIQDGIGKANKILGDKVDVLGFDTCLMAQVEVANQLSGVSNYLNATEEIEFPLGWPEAEIMKTLKEKLAKTPIDSGNCSKLIVDVASRDTDSIKNMSSIKLDRITDVAMAADKLAETLLDYIKQGPQNKDKITEAIKKTHNYCNLIPNETLCQDYRDLYDFSETLIKSKDILNNQIAEKAQTVIEKIKSAVFAEEHVGEGMDAGSHGLSIYIPYKGFIKTYLTETGAIVNPHERYLQTDFAKNTLWDELIEELKP